LVDGSGSVKGGRNVLAGQGCALYNFVGSPTNVKFEDVINIVVKDSWNFVVTDFDAPCETVGAIINHIPALKACAGEAAEVKFPNSGMNWN
jgi:hypothetical protein